MPKPPLIVLSITVFRVGVALPPGKVLLGALPFLSVSLVTSKNGLRINTLVF